MLGPMTLSIPSHPWPGWRLLAATIVVPLMLVGCSSTTDSSSEPSASDPASATGSATSIGWLLTSSNATDKNEVFVLERFDDGSLKLADTVETDGVGTGQSLVNGGAIATSEDGTAVYVVNAASNSVTSFDFDPATGSLTKADIVDSGGTAPTSLTVHDRTVYVLNSAMDASHKVDGPTLVGFLDSGKRLSRIQGAKVAMPQTKKIYSQVSFAPDGTRLMVTGWEGSQLVTAAVDGKGRVGQPVATAAKAVGPFGFDFRSDGVALVSDDDPDVTGDGASTYRIDENGKAEPITGEEKSGGDGSCWAAFGPAGDYGYIANFDSDSVTALAVDSSGAITDAMAPVGVPAKTEPRDVAVDARGSYLYVLGFGFGQVLVFGIDSGKISPAHTANDIQSHSTGLALVDR